MDLSQLSVKRQLKRAKLFEVQKLVRQIRILENKKGTDAQLQKSKRKVKRLEDVLDALKDLDLGSLAQELCLCLQESRELPSCRDCGEQVFSDSCPDRAKHRLLTNKTFQRNISRLGDSSKPRRVSDASHKHSDTRQEEMDTTMRGSEDLDSRSESSGDSDSSDSKETSMMDGAVLIQGRDTCVGSDASETESETEPEVEISSGHDTSEDSSDVQSRVVNNTAGGKKRQLSVRERKQGGRGRRRKVDVERLKSPPTGDGGGVGSRRSLESTFMGTLSVSSYSLKSPKRLKSNRPGQRTRQKKWEVMFGERAKHLASKKRRKIRTNTGKEKVAKSTKHLVSRRKAKKATSSGETQLHPSWEARRRKKAMETGIHHFQGQKTVFSD